MRDSSQEARESFTVGVRAWEARRGKAGKQFPMDGCSSFGLVWWRMDPTG